MASRKKTAKERAVVVCTDKRGVFCCLAKDTEGDVIVAREVRMCVYWSTDVHGVVGLASTGPTKSCRVTKPAPTAELRGVTAVFDCTPEALAAWRAEPWA